MHRRRMIRLRIDADVANVAEVIPKVSKNASSIKRGA